MVNQYDAFWKAFAISSAVFMTGIYVGILLDSGRVDAVRAEYTGMDIQTSDARLQNLYYQTLGDTENFCGPAIEENLAFSEKVYREGLRIDEYEKVNKFAPALIDEKRRYVLLKLQFWLNAIGLKKACNANYVNVVYFYSHYNGTAQEQVQSAVLRNLKEKYGRDMMLIPLPLDMNITTIEAIKKQYGISASPTILIDEKTVLTGLQGLGDLDEKVGKALEEGRMQRPAKE